MSVCCVKEKDRQRKRERRERELYLERKKERKREEREIEKQKEREVNFFEIMKAELIAFAYPGRLSPSLAHYLKSESKFKCLLSP